MKRPMTTAKAIDLQKDKIIMGGLALLAGLMAMAFFSSTAQAKTPRWGSYSFGENESRVPFRLKTQNVGH